MATRIEDDNGDFVGVIRGALGIMGTVHNTELGKSQYETMVNLSALIEEYRAIITNKELSTVMSDGSQLVQVFQNLIGNAIKFREEDLPHIHVFAYEEKGNRAFSIKDNGIGLAICKKIIDRHGGSIWIESETNIGSTFHFTIPK